MTADQPWDGRFEELLRETAPLIPDGPLDPAADLRDLGLDSLASVRLLVEVEAAYDIVVPDDMLTREMFATPADLWAQISTLLAAVGH